MMNYKNKFYFLILNVSGFLFFSLSLSFAGVVVYDNISTKETPVRLKILTKGRFFSQGGRLVDVYIDEQYFGRILTGGDGYGYMKYHPKRAGLKKITVKAGDDKGKGFVLIMKKNEKAIVIEIESGLKKSLFADEFREGSRKVMKAIANRYAIIYITSLLGMEHSRKWLIKKEFPESIILRWKGGGLIEDLHEKEIKVDTLIGSPAILSEAPESIEKKFTFEETEVGLQMEDWEAIYERIK